MSLKRNLSVAVEWWVQSPAFNSAARVWFPEWSGNLISALELAVCSLSVLCPVLSLAVALTFCWLHPWWAYLSSVLVHNLLLPLQAYDPRVFVLHVSGFLSPILEDRSTAVEQVVACALVTQRARVRSPVGTGFLCEVFFWGFSSPVRQMSGTFRPPKVPRLSFDRRNHHFIFALLGWLSVCLVFIVFHVCAVSEVAPAFGWSLIRGGPPCPCVVK